MRLISHLQQSDTRGCFLEAKIYLAEVEIHSQINQTQKNVRNGESDMNCSRFIELFSREDFVELGFRDGADAQLTSLDGFRGSRVAVFQH